MRIISICAALRSAAHRRQQQPRVGSHHHQTYTSAATWLQGSREAATTRPGDSTCRTTATRSLPSTRTWTFLSVPHNLSLYIAWHRVNIHKGTNTGCFSTISAYSSFLNFSMAASVCVIYSVVCLTTGPKPLPKPAVHIVRSRASSFKWKYPLLSLRSSNSFLRLLPRLSVTKSFILHTLPASVQCTFVNIF
jgi:hypothetical protein